MEDSLLGRLNQFSVHQGPFCQIIPAGCHWIVVYAPDDAIDDEVYVYDSNSDGETLHPQFIHQICQLRFTPRKYLKITLKPTHKQPNSVDCGLFAIANALELCLGRSLENVSYDNEFMRHHLISCLKNNFFTPFPKSEELGEFVGKNATLYARIFCSCRGTFLQSDLHNPDMIMVTCCKCEEQYHKKCLNVPDEVYQDKRKYNSWKCANCI